jgi:hypothetical protein
MISGVLKKKQKKKRQIEIVNTENSMKWEMGKFFALWDKLK